MSRTFAKLFSFLLLLSLSSSCSGTIVGEDREPIMGCHSGGDFSFPVGLSSNLSHEKVTATDLEIYYQNYVATRPLPSQKFPILCTVTCYETAFTAEKIKFNRRTKATLLCALSAKAKAKLEETLCSTSYNSRQVFEISRQLACVIGNYQWLTPGATVYELSDTVSDLSIITFDLNSSHPKQKVCEIVQIAAGLWFSTSQPVHGFTELRVAIPVRSVPRQFVNTSLDENQKETQITGFWIDILKAAMMVLNTTYKLVPFYGSDDQLLKEVARETYDAAVGLTVITEERLRLVEFSHPYFEVGPTLVMKKNPELNQVFSFLIPFTNEMWLTMASMTVFTAFVVWLIEYRTTAGNESGGLPSKQVGAIFWFPFGTLFYGVHGESPRNSLTYFVLAPWLLLILIVTSTYTAGFTSMITSSETDQSPCLDIENLKITNAVIGCDKDSFIFQYLVELIGFQKKNIKHISQSSFDDYAKALSNESIKAAVFLAPYAEDFLAKCYKEFRAWNLSRSLRGSAVVFPRNSPYTGIMSDAMLHLRESGKFERMKEDKLSFSNCWRPTVDRSIKRGIGPGPFSGLFILSGGASAIALLITVGRMMKRRWESFIQGMLMGRRLWVWLTILFSQIRRRNELELSRISSTSQTQLSGS